jgi:transcriptional regulator with XRE-family HTH domain
MGRYIDDIIESLPKQRRDKIGARAENIAEEMLGKADSLAAIRKVAGLTQAQLGEILGINQNAVSQMEKRTEVFFSTVRNVAVALGYDLEVAFRKPDGTRLPLPNFQPWPDANMPAGLAGAKSAKSRKQPAQARRSSQAQAAPVASAARHVSRAKGRSAADASRKPGVRA